MSLILTPLVLSSCLVLVYGGANTSVIAANVTTASPSTNWTDSSRDTLNNTIQPTTTILPPGDENSNLNQSMSLTVPIFLTPTPSPANSSQNESDSESESESEWGTTPSTPSTVVGTSTPSSYNISNPNPYPGYFLPTNSSTTRPLITLYPSTEQLQPTPYVNATPPPSPTPSIMSPSATSPKPGEEGGSGESSTATHQSPFSDKSYFRALIVLYLGVFTLIFFYVMD